ncbi:MAG: dicarboxylate/amino acid:cation symporter [Vibrio sp.]
MTNNKKKLSLTGKIIIGMIAGILCGFLIRTVFPGHEFIEKYFVNGLFDVGGQIFIASLKMLVVPLVFVSLVCGTSSLKDITTLGRLGGKTLVFYIATTCFAISVALVLGIFLHPGAGADLSSAASFTATEAPSLGQVIIDMFPSNPMQAMAEGNTLQVIVFAILFGVSISLAGEAGERVSGFFNDVNEIIMKLVMLLMEVAPYGIFFLMAKLFTTLGLDAIANLAAYFGVTVLALVCHAAITYSVLLKVFSGLNPITFWKKMKDPFMFAFSTASSNATLPITMENATHRLGVNNKVSSFTIPLGATINMDGTAIMQGVATAFIAQAFGVHLGLGDYITVIITATLASVGTAGVPGVGLVMLAMVLNQVGLPLEGIALIMGVDRLLDMIRTAINITGDSVVTCIVAKSEGEMDLDVYNNPDAGEIEIHMPKKAQA